MIILLTVIKAINTLKHHNGYFFKEKGEIAEAIKQGYLSLDKEMLQDEEMKDESAGTTAICVILYDGKIYCVIIYLHSRK